MSNHIRDGGPLGQPLTENEKYILARRIIALVATKARLDAGALLGRDKSEAACRARGVAMALVRRATGGSYPWIGGMFGGRHHTSVMQAVRVAGLDAQALDELLGELGIGATLNSGAEGGS